MSTTIRGLRDIRTISGRVDQLSVPYKSYMQVACLEMEKFRRNIERNSAHRRIAAIDARLGEIEHQKAVLLDGADRTAADLRTSELESTPGPDSSTARPGFKLSY